MRLAHTRFFSNLRVFGQQTAYDEKNKGDKKWSTLKTTNYGKSVVYLNNARNNIIISKL